MMIWSTKSQQKSTKSQHTHNTSKCTEFGGGSEFSQQMMVWSTKSQHIHNISKCIELDGGSKFYQQVMVWSTKSQQMMKLKVVDNEKLKVLKLVRTHPEEFLAPKI